MDGTIYDFPRMARMSGERFLATDRTPRRGGPSLSSPTVGVIYNPRSHRNGGQDLDHAVLPNIFVAQPRNRAALRQALANLAARDIDLLVINGGDGTVRDVLTCGQAVFGDRWPRIAVLPKGKTNALNVDLGAPVGWTLRDAIEAYRHGRKAIRRPLAIHPANDPAAVIQGFIFGAGAISTGISAGQDAHRMGAFDSLAVGVTAAWGVAQALFGSDANVWRRGVEMEILLGADRRELPHSGHGDSGRRELILASTLQRFPMGVRPFGPHREGMKVAVMDKPRRRLLALLPAILAGWAPRWLASAGVHQIATDRLELQLGGEFILDGEAFPPGQYVVAEGPELRFVVP